MTSQETVGVGTAVPPLPLLDGITVLDLSSVGPASRATRLLADFGARVIKVGPVPSDGGVLLTPPFFAYSGHRSMERVAFDLKSEDGKEALRSLVKTADVLVESFRPGVTERLGLEYSALAEINPGLIYCSTSGFGQEGPLSQSAGHDIDYLALGGYLATSEPTRDGGPPLPGATIADAAGGGMHAALSICAALVGRQSTQRGCYLDVAIADGVLWLMSLTLDEHLALGTRPGPGHDLLTGGFACYATYQTSDARWLAVGAIEAKFFATLCHALGLDEFAAFQMDPSRQAEIRHAFVDAFAQATMNEWLERLDGLDTCVAPVLSVAEIPQTSHVKARGLVVEAHHPTQGTFRQLAPVLAGMIRSTEVIKVPDMTETHTAAILDEAGVDADVIDRWRTQGVIA